MLLNRIVVAVSLVGMILVTTSGCASAPDEPREGAKRAPLAQPEESAQEESAQEEQGPQAQEESAQEHPAHEMTEEEHAAMGHEPAEAMLSERQAYERARPVFEQYCARCHTSAGKRPVALRHFTMDTYPFGGHHASDVAKSVRDALGVNGKAATMPLGQPGVVKGEQLRLILDWADAFDRARAEEGGHGHHDHQH